jgi:hypothetical protein
MQRAVQAVNNMAFIVEKHLFLVEPYHKTDSFKTIQSGYSHRFWFSLKITLYMLMAPLLKKIIIQIKLLGMSMIFHCTKLRSSKRSGSWAVFVKQKVNFKFQPPAIFTFFSAKVVWLKVVQSLKIYHNKKLYGARSASTSEVRKSAIFGMVSATALTFMASRSSSTAWPPYPFFKQSTIWFNSWEEGTDTQIWWWSH